VEHLRVPRDRLQTSLHDLLAFQFVLVAHRAQDVMLNYVNQLNVKLLFETMSSDALDELPL
jgi:hypothetical protein